MSNSGMVRDIRTIGLTYFCVFFFYVVFFLFCDFFFMFFLFSISFYSEMLKDLEQY